MKKLQRLREWMLKKEIHAFIIPTEDPHQSEYIAQCHQRRAFISDFTGSAGTCVVTLKEAALWTDGRYYLQASQQLSSDWVLQKHGLKDTPSQEDWLLQVLEPKSKIGIDSELITYKRSKQLTESLSKKGHSLVSVENLVDLIWDSRPAPPNAPVFVHDVRYAGESHQSKIKKVQELLTKKAYSGLVVSALDEIAWLFNLRGGDISFNPVFLSYAVVKPNQVYLYMDQQKVTKEIESHLDGVLIKPYDQVYKDLEEFTKNKEEKMLIDDRASLKLVNHIHSQFEVERNPIQTMKSIKNDAELQGFRDCHIRDASALVRYFAWLEKELHNGTKLSEAEAADRLEKFRSELQGFRGLSFDTISSTGPNGAIIHYKPEHGTCATIDVNKMYLCDSGGQYNDGTTDCTRTLHFGTPIQEEIDNFTLVLKGHIQLDLAVFPPGTTGYMIDVLARLPLWKQGLNFNHGTGHGVGSFLNVHEGPQSISFRISSNDVALVPGMTVTNEPGFYKDGGYGIRIENVLIVTKKDTPNRFNNVDYFGFEHVTVVPIQRKLINKSLLTAEEVEWVDTYHKKCLAKVGPLVEADADAYKWLLKETQPL